MALFALVLLKWLNLLKCYAPKQTRGRSVGFSHLRHINEDIKVTLCLFKLDSSIIIGMSLHTVRVHQLGGHGSFVSPEANKKKMTGSCLLDVTAPSAYTFKKQTGTNRNCKLLLLECWSDTFMLYIFNMFVWHENIDTGKTGSMHLGYRLPNELIDCCFFLFNLNLIVHFLC